jgi:hypothetical protein
MHYKTIALELIEEDRELHQQLCSSRTLLATVELWAKWLKDNHEAWQERLRRANPDSDRSQIDSEALEMAVSQLRDGLHSAASGSDEPLPLDEAMAYLRLHTPPA